MNRNVCLALLVLLLVGGSLFAQERLFPSSIESYASFGLFTNELDAAFDANNLRNDPGIQALNRSYIFGGLANPYWLDTDEFSTTLPFTVGAYLHPLGLSAGLEFFSDPDISTRENGTTALSTATKTVTVGNETTNYTYVDQKTETTYSALQREDVQLSLGGLKKLGPMVLGAALSFSFESGLDYGSANAYADANSTTTTTYYYDTAGAGEAPKMEEDYKETTIETGPRTHTSLSLMVPFYMPLGGPIKGIGASVRLGWENYNYSTSYKTEITEPKNSTVTGFVIDDDFSEEILNVFGFGIDSTLSLQPLLGNSPKNRLDVSVSIDTELPLPGTYKEQDVNKNVDVAPGTTTINNYTQTDTTQERAGIFKYDLDIRASHPLYFSFGDWAELALKPGIGVGLSYWPSGEYFLKSSEEVEKIDGNTDGDFNDAADTITTTTTTYYNNNDGLPVELSFPVSLGTAFKWKQKEWIFGVTLGSNMSMTPTISFESDKRYTDEEKVVVKDGTGVITSETTTTKVEGDYGTSRTTVDWGFVIANRFALNFYLPDNIRLDVLVTTNLFEFDELTIQGIIPLP